MLKSLPLNLVVAIFQLKEVHVTSRLLVKPKDVTAEPGQRASFNCSINTDEGIRWMYATERHSEMQDHIYSGGFTYDQWRKRHNVTERSIGFFTLTIDPVVPSDAGYYSCMDKKDDDYHEAKLTVSAGSSQVTDQSTASFYTSVTYSKTSSSDDLAVTVTNESKNILTHVGLIIGASCATGVFFLLLLLVLLPLYIGRRRRLRNIEHSVCEKSENERHQPTETAFEEDRGNVYYQHLSRLIGQRTSTEINSTQYAQLSLVKGLQESDTTQNVTNSVNRQHPVYEELPEPETNTYMEIAF